MPGTPLAADWISSLARLKPLAHDAPALAAAGCVLGLATALLAGRLIARLRRAFHAYLARRRREKRLARAKERALHLLAARRESDAVAFLRRTGLAASAYLLETALGLARQQPPSAPTAALHPRVPGSTKPIRLGLRGLTPAVGRSLPWRPGPRFLRRDTWAERAAAVIAARLSPLKAARLCLAVNDLERALGYLAQWARQRSRLGRQALSEPEVALIEEYMANGVSDFTTFAKVLVDYDRHVELILTLVARGEAQRAYEVMRVAPLGTTERLCANLGHNRDAARTLAKALTLAEAHGYAGMLYEQAGDLAAAAKAFERAGDVERAHHCHMRAGGATGVRRLAGRVGQFALGGGET